MWWLRLSRLAGFPRYPLRKSTGRRRRYNKQLSNVRFRLTGEMTWIQFCPAITPHRSNFTKTGLGIGAKLGPGEWTTAVCPREDIEHKRVCRVRECWDGCGTPGLESRSFVRSVPGWWNAPRKKTAMGPAALRCFQALQPMNLLACFILVFRDISTAGPFRRHLDGPTRFMWRCGRCHRVLSANVVFLSTRAPFGKTFTDLLNEGRHPNRWPNALVNAWLTSSLQ